MGHASGTVARLWPSNIPHERHYAKPRPVAMTARRLYPVIWTVAFLLSAYGAYRLVRSLLETEPSDPTRDRIRALIGEADQLLKTLDEQRRS